MRDRLLSTLAAAGVPCDGYDRETAGGTLRYPAGATAAQRAAGAAILAAFDWSPAAQAAWEVGRHRQAAAVALFGSGDPFAVGVRAAFVTLWTSHNDLREQLGLPRLLEPEIGGLILATLSAGGGDPR